MMIKGKDISPKETIQNIKSILSKVGFEFEVHTFAVSNNLWTVSLWDNTSGWSCHGKGSSRELATASAYGEAIERLQNMWLNVPLSINRGKLKNSRTLNSGEIEFSKKIFPDISNNESYLGYPFYSFATDSVVYLPIDKIYGKQGSNGMCSGNTNEEAVVQGLSEVCERWASEYVCQNHLTPPEVPREYIKENFPSQLNLIKDIEALSTSRVRVYDLTLGVNVPVIAIMIIDTKNQMYRMSVGSHPMFEIALERCLTESTQCARFFKNFEKTGNMVEWSDYNNEISLTNVMVSARLNNHNGSVPDSFFYKNPSWEFNPWKDYSNSSNSEMLRDLLNNVKKIAGDVFIRNNSYLGHPSFYIFVPKMSDTSQWFSYNSQSKDPDFFLNKMTDNGLSDEDRKFLISSIEDKNLINGLIWNNWTPLCVVLAAAYLDDGQINKAIEAMQKVPSYEKYYECVIRDLRMRGSVSEDDRDNLIRIFYGEDYLNYVKEFWREGSILANILNLMEIEEFPFYRIDSSSNDSLIIDEFEDPPYPYCLEYSDKEIEENRRRISELFGQILEFSDIPQKDFLKIN